MSNFDPLQEKFQITAPPKVSREDEAAGQWVWPHERVRKTGEAGFYHQNNSRAGDLTGPKFNTPPPGMELDNQMRKRINQMPLVIAGASDVSADATTQAFLQGYTRREMKATDDQYTGEHVDLFYGEAEDELGNVGFVERNNYLDRA